jgi:Phosphotransferase enzyme family
MAEESLGGNLSGATRIGDSVHRSTGKWTPAGHALLGFLEGAGFEAAPRVVGLDEQGREVLSYIEGESKPSPPYPSFMITDKALVQAGHLLRRFHDLSQKFKASALSEWQSGEADPGPLEVICHGDWTPYNAVFRDGELVAMVDWDFAHPGSRIWDLAWALFQWVPLCDDAEAVAGGWTLPVDRGNRLRLVCDAYGLEDRRPLLDAIVRRVASNIETIHKRAAQGDRGFQAMLETGHVKWYTAALKYVLNESDTWRAYL